MFEALSYPVNIHINLFWLHCSICLISKHDFQHADNIVSGFMKDCIFDTVVS